MFALKLFSHYLLVSTVDLVILCGTYSSPPQLCIKVLLKAAEFNGFIFRKRRFSTLKISKFK